MLAVSALDSMSSSEAQPQLTTYTAFPSNDPDDGKFLGISGKGLTLAGIPIIAYVGVPSGEMSFEIGIFDGDIGGYWDIGGASPAFSVKFELYADPLKNGTEDWLVDTWHSYDCNDDSWSTRFYATNLTAMAPSGNYFYRLFIAWDNVIPSSVLNNFKIRTDGEVSIARDQEFGFNGAPQGDYDPCVGTSGNTYDGDWRFYFYIPQSLEHIEFWDGDADRVDDTDDPNTYGANEGWNPGAPEDGPSPYGVCYNVDPSIYYVVTDPDGFTYMNDNPSGNMERERFSIGSYADEDYPVAYTLSPGLWEFHIIGMDAHNMNFIRATEVVFSTPDPPLPVNPPPEVEPNHFEEVLGAQTYYYDHSVTNRGISQAFDLRTSSAWTSRIYEDSNSNGAYDVGEPEVTQTPSLNTDETYDVLVAVDVPSGPPGADDTVALTASSQIEWAVQDSAYDEVRILQNQPPVPDANGPYIAVEGDTVTFDASGSFDPDGDTLQYMWDVDDDGAFESAYSSSPLFDFTFGDDFTGTARLRITDGEFEEETTAEVTISNIPPAIVEVPDPTALADITFRIAGEKWHDAEFHLYEDGTEIGYTCLVRYPGDPDEQAVTLTNITVSLTKEYSTIAYYTPLNDPVNGQVWGASPAWVILDFKDANETRVHHTFNVRHKDTWTWEIERLNVHFIGHDFTFQATASDPGSDDLTFTWEWGDNVTESTTHFNDGVGPDPYPSFDVNPMTSTDAMKHAYAYAGSYTLVLTVTDDDGGTVVHTLTITY